MRSRVLRILFIVLAVIASLVQNIVLSPGKLDNIVGIAAAAGGDTLVAQVEGGDLVFRMADKRGVYRQTMKIRQTSGGETSSVADFAVDDSGRVYLIRDYADALTQEYLRQDLEVYDLSRWFSKRVAVHPLENEAGVRYRWLSLSSVAVLMGVNGDASELTRAAFDPADLAKKGTPASKGTRTYSIDPAEGIYRAVPASSQVAYATMSGKVYLAAEGAAATEIYPARELRELMYPMFIAPYDGEHVLIGEQESGDISLLNLADGSTSVLQGGSERFTGVSNYAPSDILTASVRDGENYTAVVRNSSTGFYELVVSEAGSYSVVGRLTSGLLFKVLSMLGGTALYFVGLLLLYAFAVAVASQVRGSRTILLKLAFSALPLLAVALVLFGVFSYNAYSDSISGSFQKQVEDEGNLLTALFGTESFNEIEYPYDYTTEGYRYLDQQMRTRAVYTRTAYYEGGRLYTGVDRDLPCFYPFELVMNSEEIRMHREAAFTGETQTGEISDRMGRRVICVTPIGGVEGDTVYLLETSIPSANMDRYTGAYLRNYIIIAAVFLLVIGALLLVVFMRVLGPLVRIKDGLEEFSEGNRRIRLESDTRDELSDIARVFNKMAGDIDVQLYNLRGVSDTYFRFVPQRIFRLLGKDNLGDLQPGSHVQGDYNVLCVNLWLSSDKMPLRAEQELINRFFNIINEISDQYDATLVVDSVNLCSLKVICPKDGEDGVSIALAALAQIDGHNASAALHSRLDVTFLLHRAELYYGICGDEQRYIPAMISQGLEAMTQRLPLIRQLSSRLVVTQDAYATLDSERYYNRFIGFLGDRGQQSRGLYDFYDGSSPEIIRLINDTRLTFDKAMQLYQQKRYYDAKNLFAVVLRENQYDNVARHYIFQCEKKL